MSLFQEILKINRVLTFLAPRYEVSTVAKQNKTKQQQEKKNGQKFSDRILHYKCENLSRASGPIAVTAFNTQSKE